MAITSLNPIKQALVQYLRADPALQAGLTGGIHEGFAPPKTAYPLLTYSIHYAPHMYTWTSMDIQLGMDIFVFSENSVEADNLDALLLARLHEAALQVTGQSTLICRRISSLSLPDSNEEGKKIYQVGGIYEMWTNQPLPETKASGLTANAVIV